jgi:hypothetical protein
MSPSPIPAVPRKRKNLIPAEVKRAEELARIMQRPKSTIKARADAAIELMALTYEKQPDLVCRLIPYLVKDGQRIVIDCNACGKRPDVMHCTDVDNGTIHCAACCPVHGSAKPIKAGRLLLRRNPCQRFGTGT